MAAMKAFYMQPVTLTLNGLIDLTRAAQQCGTNNAAFAQRVGELADDIDQDPDDCVVFAFIRDCMQETINNSLAGQ